MNAHHSSSAELFKWLTAMFVELLLLLPGQCIVDDDDDSPQGKDGGTRIPMKLHIMKVYISLLRTFASSLVRPVLCKIRDAIDGTDDDDNDEQEESI